MEGKEVRIIKVSSNTFMIIIINNLINNKNSFIYTNVNILIN